MNTEYKSLLPSNFSANSKVWIYQCNRLFSLSEALQIEDMLNDFTANWQSHGTPVKGFATLFFGRFIIMMADETTTDVSGCSTDSSVRIVKEIERIYGVNLFDRTTLAFLKNEKIEMLPMAQLAYAFENGFINGDTLFFNNLVSTKTLLENEWLIPLKNSWLQARINQKKIVTDS